MRYEILIVFLISLRSISSSNHPSAYPSFGREIITSCQNSVDLTCACVIPAPNDLPSLALLSGRGIPRQLHRAGLLLFSLHFFVYGYVNIIQKTDL